MTKGHARFILFAIYIVVLTLNLYFVRWAWEVPRCWLTDDMQMFLYKQLFALYLTPVLLMIQSLLASRDNAAPIAWIPFGVALVLGCLWNWVVSFPVEYLITKAGPKNMNLAWNVEYWKTMPELTAGFATAAVNNLFMSFGGSSQKKRKKPQAKSGEIGKG
jgi:hypothetical protein